MRRNLTVTLAFLVGIAFLLGGVLAAGAVRFRVPSTSPAAAAILVAILAGVAWFARRGHSWASRIEIAILLATGGYAVFAPTIFTGTLVWFTRSLGIAATILGLGQLIALVRIEMHVERNGPA